MSVWTRVGLLGSVFYCIHRKRMVYAERSRDGDEHRRHANEHRRDGDEHSRHDGRNGDEHRRHGNRRDGDEHRRHDGRNGDEHRRHGDRRDGDEHRRHDDGRNGDEHRRHGNRRDGDEHRRHDDGRDEDEHRRHGDRRDGDEHRRHGDRRDGEEHRKHGEEHKRDGTHRTSDRSDHELKLVQVMFRHGARTPLKPIPHKEQVEWPLSILDAPDHTQFKYTVTDLTGGPQPPSSYEERYRSTKLKGGTFPGQLTTIGMKQMFKLGERLRKTYIEEHNFLSPVFKPSEVFVRSTNIVRNVESARCLLAGLFQQQQEGPVTIVTSESINEILYPNYDCCQGLKQLTSNKMLNASSQPGMSEELKKLQREIGIDRKKDAGFFLLLDNLLAQEVHGLPGTLVLKNLLHRTERRVIDIVSYVMERNRELLQMSVGAFLHTVQKNMLEVVKSSTPSELLRKLFLFAVHDVTLIPLLMVLGIFDKKWPPYASDLTLELYQHKHSQEWYARLCYNGEEQVVKGCRTGLCPLEDFLNAISGYVLTAEEYRTLCSKTATVNQEEPKKIT